MTTRVYKYEIQTTQKGKRCYKKYVFTFLLEFSYNNTSEWIEKTSHYIRQSGKIHFVDVEKDGNYYIYLRHKKYLLDKGVSII